jgi:cytidylate kinase
VIAIDGPAASGKSTVGRELGLRLGFAHVNTGVLYRAVTWKLLDGGVDLANPEQIAERAEKLDVEVKMADGQLVLTIDGIDPLPHLRDEAVNRAVSPVAAVPAVRALLLDQQRALADFGPIIVEGRDIGSVVFPSTPYKYFIDAHPDERARRRAKQGEADSIADRDRIDAARKAAPLRRDPDAILIDTTNVPIDAVINQVIASLKEKGLPQAVALRDPAGAPTPA